MENNIETLPRLLPAWPTSRHVGFIFFITLSLLMFSSLNLVLPKNVVELLSPLVVQGTFQLFFAIKVRRQKGHWAKCLDAAFIFHSAES